MAVYTPVTDQDLEQFLDGYAIGRAVSCKGIAEGVENSNFLLVTDQGPFILTLYEKRVRAEQLPWFIGLMDHLSARGVPCPTPVRDRAGQALGVLNGRPAAIVTFLTGMWPRRPGPDHTQQLGAALARLHLAGQDYPPHRANNLSLEGWQHLAQQCAPHADGVQPGLQALVGDELDRLSAQWPVALPAGVIHADLFPDNVFFQDGTLSGLIDFYFACNDLLAYDLGVCLNAWCFEDDLSFNITSAQRLLSAYHAVRPLSAAEWQALPLLAAGAALRFLLTRLYDWVHTPAQALVQPKDPLAYAARLKFHRAVRGPGDYGWSGPL